MRGQPIAAPSAFGLETLPPKKTTKKTSKKGGTPWTNYVKAYAAANNMTYREAIKVAGPSYRAQQQVGGLVMSSARRARAIAGDTAAKKRKAAEKRKKQAMGKGYYY